MLQLSPPQLRVLGATAPPLHAATGGAVVISNPEPHPPGRPTAHALAAARAERRATHHHVAGEGGRFVPRAARFYKNLVAPGYRDAATLLQRAIGAHSALDAEALSVIVVGALVNSVRNRWTFGARALDVGDERLVHTLVELIDVVTSSHPFGAERSTTSTSVRANPSPKHSGSPA